MTEILFLCFFICVMGFLAGKCFKRGNPFLIIFGLFVFIIPVALVLFETHQEVYFIPFIFGWFYCYDNPLTWLKNGISDVRISYQLAKAKSAAQAQDEMKQTEQDIKNQAEELRRQKIQAEEEIKRASEELRRKQEAFQQQQSQYQSNNNSNQSQFDSAGLDPRKFEDACSILGVHAGSSLAEFKKAYRHLSNLFHPDKLDKFDGVLKQQAKENAKLINIAWETIQRKLK